MMNIEIFGATDVGNVRELNEDSYEIVGFENSHTPGICILADGMGGHNAGEVASQNAVRFSKGALSNSFILDEKEIPGLLAEASDCANENVYKMSVSNPQQSGMGTTLVIAYVTDGTAYVSNIGDSRAYAIRGETMCRITVDHSIVEELVANGTITREEASFHPQKNIITRAVGTEPTVKTDIYEYTYISGDIMLMCSDGLYEMVSDDEIIKIASSGESIQTIVNQLIASALEAGGHDNVTVIGIRFT